MSTPRTEGSTEPRHQDRTTPQLPAPDGSSDPHQWLEEVEG